MVKFTLEKKGSLGRLGNIEQWGEVSLSHATPSFMTYLRGGHIPHLTWDVAAKQLELEQTPIYQMTLPSLIESTPIISKFGKGAPAFCGVPTGSAVHLSTHDPLMEYKTGFNDSRSIALWTKSGKKCVDVKLLREVISAYGCASFDTLLDYDLQRDALNKRSSKAIDRTRTFYEQMFQQDCEVQGSVLVSLGGGFSDYFRRKCAVDLGLNSRCDGYNVDLHDFTDEKEVDRDELKKLLEETFAPLPPARLRYVCGPFDPSMVLFLTKQSIDLFDSSYPIKLAEQGKALKLADDYPHSAAFELMDFNLDKYADDFTTPFPDCKCYCCTKYTKGYLHHLNNTKELLCPILLVIHNMTEYQRMFTLLRQSINDAESN